MARKKKIIQIPPKNVQLLADAVQCKKATVWGALAYRSDSEKAQQIRRLALSTYGGIQTTKLIEL